MDHLTTQQAGDLLGVSAQRVLALIRDGDGKGGKPIREIPDNPMDTYMIGLEQSLLDCNSSLAMRKC